CVGTRAPGVGALVRSRVAADVVHRHATRLRVHGIRARGDLGGPRPTLERGADPGCGALGNHSGPRFCHRAPCGQAGEGKGGGRRSASGARTDRLIPVLLALFRGSFLPRRPRPFLCRGARFGQFPAHQDDPEDQGGDTEDAPLERVAQTAPVHGDAGGWLRRRDGGQTRSGRVVLGQHDVPLVEVVFPLLEEDGGGYAFDLPLGHLHRPDTFRGGLGGQQPTGGGDLSLRWGGKIVILVL